MIGHDDPIYCDPDRARAHLEALRWPDGAICPYCGVSGEGRVARLSGASARTGLRKCYDCRRTFSVTVGTFLERSHVPLETWVLAAALMTETSGGVSVRRLHREIGVTYKTAWSIMQRIRSATGASTPGRSRHLGRGWSSA